MIARKRKQKSIDQYQIPEQVRRRVPELVDMLDTLKVGCPLYGAYGQQDVVVTGWTGTHRIPYRGCRALEQTTCYAKNASKDYTQVDSFEACPVYQFILRQNDLRDSAGELGDPRRTLR